MSKFTFDDKLTHPGPTQKEVSKTLGQLKTSSTCILHTYQALALWRGKRPSEHKRGFYGVPYASLKLLEIENKIINDDPYADALYLMIENRITSAQEHNNQQNEQLHFQVVNKLNDSFSFSKSISINPISIELNFKCPLAYKLVHLITIIDQYVRTLITLKHIGEMSSKECSAKAEKAANSYRSIIALVQRFDYTKTITRWDVVKKTSLADELKNQFEWINLTDDMLKRINRATTAPEPTVDTIKIPPAIPSEILPPVPQKQP
ncbi:PFL_4669 family integrating conjugative element protein [uncultured Shewanella sp.]|uniref:PFL_4669 family integrating conjugative element protein n=1 Tax=uncultured Shewanella sp. TaxID=173975 RepID=UPI0026300AAE|nr:TIGR03761 family integrating conjugative element protein [uncultured Shewanella sp.]